MVTIQVPGNPALARRLGATFASMDLLFPPYLSFPQLSFMAEQITQANPAHKSHIATDLLRVVYGPHPLAARVTDRYTKLYLIKDFSPQISEAIEVYFSGYTYSAITALLPVFEGIVRKIATHHARDVGHGTRNVVVEIDKMIEKENASPNRFEERLVMLEAFRDFVRYRLLADTRSYSGADQFNRHGILHGIFDDYADDLNFYRAIILLENICFFMAYITPVSSFAPDNTPESDRLAKRYIRLRRIALKLKASKNCP